MGRFREFDEWLLKHPLVGDFFYLLRLFLFLAFFVAGPLLLFGLVVVGEIYELRFGGDAFNEWLEKHPVVLGVIALMFGAVIWVSGIAEKQSGIAHDKFGNEIVGQKGQFIANARIVVGVWLCGFGVYKIVAG